ncbi:MAG TPA: GGDEF domain-containing protein [Gaiellaceae bacterium]|nr:GGDEF domain-containing protein [Gaiellaceae bacterium]
MRLRPATLDRRTAVAAAVVALVVGALIVGVEALVTHQAKISARDRIRDAAERAQTLSSDLRRAAAQRAENVTLFPQVQGAFARHDAGALSRFSADHPNVAFTLRSGAVVGKVDRRAVVSRLAMVSTAGRLGAVIAGVLPTDAQLATLRDASPGVRFAYVVDGIRQWPSGAAADGDVTASVPFPSEGSSSLRLATSVSEIPARALWPPLGALLAAIVAAQAIGAGRGRRVHNLDVARSLDIVGETLAATHDPQALLPVVLKAATEATGASGGVILTNDVPRVSRGTTNGNRADRLEVPLRTETGTTSVLRLYSGAEPFDQDAREAAKWIATQAEIALENAHLHRLVQQQALTDDLTSLPNRRRFMTEFRRESQRADRAGTPLSVIVLDIDDFKQVNDTWGHETGDLVLRGLAEALAAATRSVDLAARLGGEEFAILLPNTDAQGAEGVAARIQRDLATMTVTAGDELVQATASFGISSFPDLAALNDLLNDADRCLYEAKRAGKNRIVVSAA